MDQEQQKNTPLKSLSNFLGTIACASYFVLMCKFIHLFAKRKTDALPFLMSKDWMIAAIIISAICLVPAILTFISDGKIAMKGKIEDASLPSRILGALISFTICIATITMFSLFLQNKIPYEKVAYFTKVMALIDIVTLSLIPVIIVVVVLVLVCCGVGLCCVSKSQSAAKEDNFKININSLLNDSLNNNGNTLEVSNLNKPKPELNVDADSTNKIASLNETNDLKIEQENSTNITVSSEDLKNLFNNKQKNENFVTV